MDYFYYILCRVCYINWIILCWICAAGLVISLLSYGSLIGFLIYVLLSIILPVLYQRGLTVADFEECSNMFELDVDDEDEEE
jgi:hypothetical protein